MWKLVRDKIPRIAANNHQMVNVRVATIEEMPYALMDKLQEEVEEYIESRNLEELADILEVLIALADQMGSSFAEVDAFRQLKRIDRGGFDIGLVMEVED